MFVIRSGVTQDRAVSAGVPELAPQADEGLGKKILHNPFGGLGDGEIQLLGCESIRRRGYTTSRHVITFSGSGSMIDRWFLGEGVTTSLRTGVSVTRDGFTLS